MSIEFACPRCNIDLEAGVELFGSKIACPSCQTRIQVPTADEIEALRGEAAAPEAVKPQSGKPRLNAPKSRSAEKTASNVYAAPSSSRNREPLNEETCPLEVPAHAAEYLNSLRKGSPVSMMVISMVFLCGAYGLLLVGAVNRAQEMLMLGAAGVLLCLPFLIYSGILYNYRVTALANLSERPSPLSPTLMAVLSFIPLANLVPACILLFVLPRRYRSMLQEQGLQGRAPDVNPLFPILSLIPLIGIIFGLWNLIQWSQALNHFARLLKPAPRSARR
ncbi:MAG: hypothetical protein RL095_3818 [Verrucomicrobiota bacterium]|jgi:uncharacterized Zn finger protein (UPF0148 family)